MWVNKKYVEDLIGKSEYFQGLKAAHFSIDWDAIVERHKNGRSISAIEKDLQNEMKRILQAVQEGSGKPLYFYDSRLETIEDKVKKALDKDPSSKEFPIMFDNIYKEVIKAVKGHYGDTEGDYDGN